MDFLTVGGLSIAGIAAMQLMTRARREESLGSNAHFSPITTMDELNDVFSTADGRPKVVFLDDPWCPISAAARRQVRQLDGEVRTIDVSRRSDLARQLEARTGIRHESPQVIVINDGVAVWDASHGGVRRRVISEVIARYPTRLAKQ